MRGEKSHKITKRITTWVLTLFLVMGEIGGSGFTVRAADPAHDESISEDAAVSSDETEEAVSDNDAEEDSVSQNDTDEVSENEAEEDSVSSNDIKDDSLSSDETHEDIEADEETYEDPVDEAVEEEEDLYGDGEFTPGERPANLWIGMPGGTVDMVKYNKTLQDGNGGTMTYDASTCTLTMKDFHISGIHKISGMEAYGIYCPGSLTIVVDGDCYIDGNAGNDMSVIEGIHVTKNLVIKSSDNVMGGELYINMGGKAKTTATAIYCNQTLTVQDGLLGGIYVKATASDAVQNSYGIRTGAGIVAKSGFLTGEGGTVTSNSRGSYGIESKGTITINGGDVCGIGGKASGTSTAKSCGVYLAGELVVSDGSLLGKNNAVSGDSFTSACAVEVTKAVKVTGGTLEAVSSKAGSAASSYGLKSTESVSVTGGKLNISSGDAAGGSSIALDAGTVSITGGTVKAVSGEAKNESYGIRLTDKNQIETKITGGTITAKAGNASSSFGLKVNNYLTLNRGKLTAQGYTESISAAKPKSGTDPTIKAPVFEGSVNYDGSESVLKADYDNNAHWKYVVLNADTALVLIEGWTYGDTPKTPSVANLDRYGDGNVTAAYKYITRNNRNITKESDTPPENASGGTEGIIYSVKAVLANGVTGETAFDIEKRNITDLTASYTEPVYNGTEQAVVFTVKYKNTTLKEGVDYVLQATAKATDVGENMVMLRCTGNYKGSKPYYWSLKKATPLQSMFRVQQGVKKVYKDLPYKYSLKYNGRSFSAKEALLKPDYSGCGTICYHYRDVTGWSDSELEKAYDDLKEFTDDLPSKPGTYAVIMSFDEGQNFKALKLDDNGYVIYGTVVCSKGDNRISSTDITAGTGGRQCDLSYGAPNADGEVTYTIDGEDLGCTVNGNILTTGNSAGTIVINAKAAGNEYYDPRTVTFNVEIKDMKFESMTISQQSATYGNELPDAIPSPIAWTKKPTAQYTGLLMDGTPYSSSAKPKKAGTYTVTLTGETDDTVYTGSAEFFIYQKEATFSGVKVIDKIYDGNNKAELDTSAMTLEGVLPGDSVMLHLGAVYDDEKAGKNKNVYYTETWFEGADGSNYIPGTLPADVKAEIKPRPVTVTAVDQEVVMGSAVSSGVEYAKLEGAVYDHTLSAVTITGNTSSITDSGKVMPSAAKIADKGSEDVTANYSITYAEGNLRVSGKSIEGAAVEVSGSYSYSGSAIVPKDADITVSLGEDVLKKGTDYKLSVTDNLNAGTASVIAEGIGNYSGKASGLFIIDPCVLDDPDIDIAPASYTGASVEPNVTVTDNKGNKVNPGEYSVIYSNNIKVSSEAKVTVVDKEGGNYIVSGSALFEIKKGATRNLEDINRNIGSKTQIISVPLSPVMPSDMGTISKYEIYEEEVTSGSVIVDDAAIGIDGILKLEVHGGKAGDAIVQSVHIIGQNYDCLISVKIKLNELADPVYTAPEAKELSYTGKEQALIKAGSVSKGGVMEYSLDESTWSTSVPVAIEAGMYTVYWRISETAEVNGVDPTPLSVYIKGASYKLTVQNGSGSGNYEAGESVTIVANAPASGKVFDKWSCDDDILFADATAMTTGFIMPSKAITVKALYKADEKPMPQLTKVPAPKANLRYNYNSQVLIERGETVGGILYYALGENTKKAPDESKYKISLPLGCEAGYYYVWYYIKGDSSHANTAPAYITVVMNNADGTAPEAPHGEDIPDPVIDPSYLDSAFSIVPYIDSTTTELHIVKGQKFNMPEKGWKSDKSKIIKISKSGKLSAKKTTGTSDPVTLSHDGRLDIKVYVTQPHFEKKSLSMSAGESRSCGFVLEDTKLPVFFSSASPDVATVDQYGTIKAVGKGSAVITAYVNSKAYNCKIKVTESTPQTTRTLHLSVGDKKTVNVKGLKKVTWESSNSSVVSVSKNNKIKAEGKGSAKLTTVYESVTYEIYVTVEDPSIVSGFKGSKRRYSTEMKAADVKQIEFNSLGFDDPIRQVVFKSSKPAVAFVDEQGRIIAVGKGKTKLTSKINGKSISITVTVK